jgi:hypothetical protein
VISEIQEWRQYGNCAKLEPEEADDFFFLGRGGSPMKARQNFCDGCPVKQNCFEFAIVHDENGIWGGATEKERKIVAPFLRPALEAKARLEGWLEERRQAPIVLQQSDSGPTEYQLPQEILDDIDLNTYLQTGS